MASFFDTAFALQSMEIQQKHNMLHSSHINRPKNTEALYISSPHEYAGAHENLKIEDETAQVNLEVNLPTLWPTLHQNITNRDCSHDGFPMGTISDHALTTDVLLFQNGYSVGRTSQQSVETSSVSPPSPSTKSTFPKIIKPRIATLYWEEEHTTCYQVRAHDVVVSRRENDNYINGTKLLNVTGMTRGRRDGMLKIEKGRSVVRNGSMDLKGVWIPFSRAVEIARNEGVDQILYPLLVENIRDFFCNEGLKLRQEAILEGEEDSEKSADQGHRLGLGSLGSQSSQDYGTRMY